MLSTPAFSLEDVDGFWDWFSKNADALRAALMNRALSDSAVQGLTVALAMIHPGLVFEIGVDQQDLLDLVISADGIEDTFPAVLTLTRAMPRIEGCKVTAFRPRQEVQVEIAGRRLSADDATYVSAIDHERKLAYVRVYLPLPEDADEASRRMFGFLLLDSVLGEYDASRSLGGIEFCGIEEAPADAKSLSRLASEVDAMNAAETRH